MASVDYRGNFAPMDRLISGLAKGVFATILLVSSGLPSPVHADNLAHCNAQNSELWIQAEALIAEGRTLMDQAADMAVKNVPGWGDTLREGGRISRKGHDLKDQAFREAHQCRMNAMREETKRRENEQSLTKDLNEEAKSRIIGEVKSKFPELSKYYDFGKTQWDLFQDKGNIDATLGNVSSSMAQLRALPMQPVSPAWSLSGSLLEVTTEEYQRIVKDSLTDLEISLHEFDDYIHGYLSGLSTRVGSRRASERKWDTWKEPFRSSSRETSPSASSTRRSQGVRLCGEARCRRECENLSSRVSDCKRTCSGGADSYCKTFPR